MKMQTSIKLVEGGKNLTLKVKRVLLKGESLEVGQIQTVCSEIGKRYKIPAVPYTANHQQEILIPEAYNLPTHTISVNEWLITPSGSLDSFILDYRKNTSKQLIADLYKRALLLTCKEPFWTLDSPRILYERTAFRKIDGIAVVRRFEVSEVLLEEGLGISVGLTTAFFSINSILEIFNLGGFNLIDQITNRQKEQQGTLMYKGPRGYSKCYFEKNGFGKRLVDTPSFKEGGNEYANAYEYYQKKYPQYVVSPDDKAAMVSFPGFNRQVYVPAKNLYPRIFNSELEGELQNIDKIGTDEKKKYLHENFWKVLGSNPFGKGFSKIENGFFTPPAEKKGIIPLPGIIAGKNVIVPPPTGYNAKAYKDHFRNRKTYLDKYGCFYAPVTLSGSKVYFAFPDTIPVEVQERYVNDIIAYLKKLLRNEIELETIILPAYKSYLQATVSLKNDHEHGMVVFVFDDTNPATYSLIDFELRGDWNIKRATSYELLKKYNILKKFSQSLHQDDRYDKAKKDWDSYIEMTVLGILQKMNCIPFTVQSDLFNYDMQIVIDVSEDFSHFCVSGLMYTREMTFPLLPCQTERKTDEKKETINPQLLKDEIKKMLTGLKKQILRYDTKKYLFARDGKDCGEEFNAVIDAFKELQDEGVLPGDATYDFVEYHKTTRKEIRLWEVDDNDTATNVLEGSYYLMRSNIAIMCTTGAGTLSNRVTADPITIINKYTNADIIQVLTDIFYGAQFNFSSPRVAQKHSLPMKRADDELTEKRAQQIKRIK